VDELSREPSADRHVDWDGLAFLCICSRVKGTRLSCARRRQVEIQKELSISLMRATRPAFSTSAPMRVKTRLVERRSAVIS
jgi:hypothetical protein